MLLPFPYARLIQHYEVTIMESAWGLFLWTENGQLPVSCFPESLRLLFLFAPEFSSFDS